MLHCYYRNKRPIPGHIHDEKSVLIDAMKFIENGWQVNVSGTCYHPEVPFVLADLDMREPTFLLCTLLREIKAWGQDYFTQMVSEEIAAWWDEHTCYYCKRVVPA